LNTVNRLADEAAHVVADILPQTIEPPHAASPRTLLPSPDDGKDGGVLLAASSARSEPFAGHSRPVNEDLRQT
jgi:hypothetical protein